MPQIVTSVNSAIAKFDCGQMRNAVYTPRDSLTRDEVCVVNWFLKLTLIYEVVHYVIDGV